VAISVSLKEQAELEGAARSEGVSAFVADKALAAARRTIPPAVAPLREALAELIRATVQVQKVGTNLNQAGNLVPYARYAAKVIERLDEAAERVSKRLP
jgi:hypothetical protein